MTGNKGNDMSDFDGFALDMSSEEEEEEEEVVVEEDEDEDEDEDEGDDGEFEEQEKEAISLGGIEGDGAADGSGIQFYQQFDHVEYEALAAKKRKGLGDSKGAGSHKKARQEDLSGASIDEIMEAMNYGIRRKSRKLKKRGRRKGSKNKLSPEITKMLGDATVLYAHGRYEDAISVLNEVVRLAPHVPDSYHTLGLVHIALGNTEKAMGFYTIAARLMPKDSPLWRVLFDWHNERGDVARARLCLSKAIRADPNDIALRVLHASLYAKLGDCQRAAESYEQISRVCPEDVEVLKISAKLYAECGQTERSISILENHLKSHPSGADFGVIDLLAAILMETNAYNNALQHIEHAHQVYYSGKELPLELKIKAGICHVRLGNIEKAEIMFSDIETESDSSHAGLIMDVADAFMSLGHFESALKYYHMLESNAGIENEGYVHLKVGQCYISLEDRVKAVMFFYKALHALEDSVDCRLALASLVLEDGKEDEAISLLSPPENLDSVNLSSDKQKAWWLDGKIKLKLCQIYRAKGMLEDFVNTIFPLVRESLYVKTLRQKVKKRLTISVLRQRTKILDVGETVDVFGGVRPLASRSDLLKASRARKLLQKKEEQKAVERAAGIDWHSDDSDDESLEEEIRVPPLPNFLKDEEHHNLIIDLCKALQSLERYWEALEIINLTRKLVYKKLPVEKKEELQSIAAQISYRTTDPKHGFDCVKSIVLQHPDSHAAWNCYYKIALRLGKNYSKHAKFLRHMRTKHDDCVPPIVIYGHQFTMASHYQDAVREYLAAYKLLPENPLVNLCVGTAFINLALGFRLQNKHQCVAQGLSFLYNNLRLAENSQVSLQEAFYNIACAFHHVGLVSLAASYYEKVLETRERDYPIPKLLNENSDPPENLNPGYCDLRREAAYNLHLIYKRSGAFDLARQVLKDHCTY